MLVLLVQLVQLGNVSFWFVHLFFLFFQKKININTQLFFFVKKKKLLNGHPQLRLKAVGASPSRSFFVVACLMFDSALQLNNASFWFFSVGKTLVEATRWVLEQPMPKSFESLIIGECNGSCFCCVS